MPTVTQPTLSDGQLAAVITGSMLVVVVLIGALLFVCISTNKKSNEYSLNGKILYI